MRDWIVATSAIGVMLVGVLFCCLAAGEVIVPEPTLTDSATPTAERITIVRKAAKDETPEGGRLTIRQRREMGATFANCRRIMKQLDSDGALSDDPAVATTQVASVLLKENPKGFSDAEDAGIDWDNFMEFLEKLIEMIMRIMALFS